MACAVESNQDCLIDSSIVECFTLYRWCAPEQKHVGSYNMRRFGIVPSYP